MVVNTHNKIHQTTKDINYIEIWLSAWLQTVTSLSAYQQDPALRLTSLRSVGARARSQGTHRPCCDREAAEASGGTGTHRSVLLAFLVEGNAQFTYAFWEINMSFFVMIQVHRPCEFYLQIPLPGGDLP